MVNRAKNMSDVPVPTEPESWVLSQKPSGAWRVPINLQGERAPPGYFGAREDAEETIAACFQPPGLTRTRRRRPAPTEAAARRPRRPRGDHRTFPLYCSEYNARRNNQYG